MGLRILSDELEALLREKGFFVSSGIPSDRNSDMQGVAHNTSEIRGGELFIGLVGQTANGGDFAADAIERGAAFCLINQAAAGCLSSEVLESCIIVTDTLEAFWDLARWWIKKVDIPIIAVTGSVGKTTVKELLAAILVSEGPGLYSQRSYNNHVGVPATLCRAEFHHKWGVIEVGMNSPGEIARLATLFVAKVAVITCIAEAHLERLESREGILREKLDITKTLTPGGVLVVYGDDERLQHEAQRVAQLGSLKLKSFGEGKCNDIRIKSVFSHGLDGVEVSLNSEEKAELNLQWEESFRLNLPGSHNGLNIAAAVCAALELFPKLNLEGINRRLARFRPPVMRMQVVRTNLGVRILCDCFNANPKSMQAFLDLAQDELLRGKVVVLVVGEMRELGEISEERHQAVSERACGLGVLKVVFVGEGFQSSFSEHIEREGVKWFSASEGVHAVLMDLIERSAAQGCPVDLVMVKGSRALKLEVVVDALIESCGGEQVYEVN